MCNYSWGVLSGTAVDSGIFNVAFVVQVGIMICGFASFEELQRCARAHDVGVV
jgi:hypothetical protein